MNQYTDFHPQIRLWNYSEIYFAMHYLGLLQWHYINILSKEK